LYTKAVCIVICTLFPPKLQ